MNALANPEVGKYIGKHFIASFQKVATFKIVNGQKQGGNVASYFCAPDGRVLHIVAGPVNAATLLKEAKWVVETVKKSLKESKRTGGTFKAAFRTAHAARLRTQHGLVVKPVTVDTTAPEKDSPLTYNDPTGRVIVPTLPPAPIDGPDVSFKNRASADAMLEASIVPGRRGQKCRVRLGTGWQVHQLMAAHSLRKIEKLYATVFQNILGERVSTDPVVTLDTRSDSKKSICLHCSSMKALKALEE